MGMSTENRSVTRTSVNTVRGVMLVQWASRQRFRLLMVEKKKVSSCVNYRRYEAVNVKETKTGDSGQLERTAQLGEKQNAIREKNVFVCMGLSKRRRKGKKENEKEKRKQRGENSFC